MAIFDMARASNDEVGARTILDRPSRGIEIFDRKRKGRLGGQTPIAGAKVEVEDLHLGFARVPHARRQTLANIVKGLL